MVPLSELLRRNRHFAAHADLTRLTLPTALPDRLLLILTCLDPRVEPAGFLGLGPGEAAVLRNAGGRVDERVTQDIALLALRFGVRMDVAIIQHTQCGTGLLADPAFRRDVADRTGAGDAELTAKAVTDPVATVRQDVARLLAHPLAADGLVVSVSGHAFRLETGLVETVVDAVAPAGRHAA
ncbi:carbonic anhydrase [Actinoplanes sp. SE50]|uniref:carbonic anhydrase n=1 Tax=unclassified Actinoplanes TaxID=2626549 RepID=UPI00023ED458|nr:MULTISPECIES: carbonic anhydrase [unclassified Actinoplanes]AEV84996.1 Carbonic anhydrase [Actinoplanes sp. SE50/110]ATO83387.1 carbonic anhydrase [Actinoplanes sp. SE50]SLM00794.1 carbonic anhydrase [Actinoplanes sp. SE50/110]